MKFYLLRFTGRILIKTKNTIIVTHFGNLIPFYLNFLPQI